MKNIIYIFLLFSLSSSVNGQWIQTYNGTGNNDDRLNAIKVGYDGNIYVVGQSKGISTGFDYVTIKYSPFGSPIWIQRYLRSSNDIPSKILIDPIGNVFVTGYSGDGNTSDIMTLKYNSSGVFQWARTYGHPTIADNPYSMALDDSGNVYVAGKFGNSQAVTIKYNTLGIQKWVQKYIGPANYDFWKSIVTDSMCNVYVTGLSTGSGTGFDYLTIKYNSSGIQQWIQRYDGPTNTNDRVNSIGIDKIGNVYITGRSESSGEQATTIKYNPSGDEQWVRRYNAGPNQSAGGNSLVVDKFGNIYVTGYDKLDFLTIKYNSSGDELWFNTYNGPENGIDFANSIAVDSLGNVYVTGNSASNCVTIKYNSLGVQQWVQSSYQIYQNYSESGSGSYIALDAPGNIYVAGSKYNGVSNNDFTTIKYLNQSQPITQPSLSLSTVQINSGASVNITGQNFRVNAQVKVNVISSNSQVVLDQIYTASSSGGFNSSYSSNINSPSGIYSVSAYDISTNQNAPYRTFEVIEPQETFNMNFYSPSSDSVSRTVNIEWTDKMIKGSAYSINNTKRHYKYKIKYTTDDGISWSSDFISEGDEYINSTPVLSKQINISSLNNSSTTTHIKFNVTDYYNTTRFCESQTLPLKNSELTKSSFNLKWDYHSRNNPGEPKGVCADSVCRIYLKITKLLSSPNITSINVKLSDYTNNTLPGILGKLMVASVNNNNQYSDEANNANQSEVNIINQNDNWIWYVSPDNFVRPNTNDSSESERIVKATIRVNYADATSETGTYNISIVRTPLMLVHGFGSNKSVWDVFNARRYFNNKFKFITTPQMETEKSYGDNGLFLLNGNQTVYTYQNSFQCAINSAREKGYASNQVSYVCHSMGGGMARAAFELPGYYSEQNYGKGFIDRLITIDTPHNGSPLADFFVQVAEYLNKFSLNPSEIVLKNEIKFFIKHTDDPLFKSSYIVNDFNIISCTAGLIDLQTSLGKHFISTNIPSYLIAGDLFTGTSNDFSYIDWNRLNNEGFNKFLDRIYKILILTILLPSDFYDSVADYLTAISLIANREITKKETSTKLINLIYKKLLGSDTLLPNSDYVVSVSSQLANTVRTNFNTFDKYNGDSNALGVGHAFINDCTKDTNIANTVMKYLNLPTNEGFIQPIPRTVNNLFESFNRMHSSLQSMVDTTNHIELINPENSHLCIVDEQLNVSFTLNDTTNLKYVTVSFQGEDYYDTVKAFNYNFSILINGNEMDSSILNVSALYINGDTLNYSNDYKTLFVKSNSAIVNFDVRNDFYFLINNQSVTPDYKTVFSNHIYEGTLNSITATVDNPSVIMFNNIDKSFKAISTGETFATVDNGGKSDTIYFVINSELLTPGKTNLVAPIDSAILNSSNLTFSWYLVEYAANYNFQIAKDINFESIVFENNNLSDTNISVSSVEDSIRYYWRVRAANSVGLGNWSSIRSFIAMPIRPSYLYMTLLPQGFYNEATKMLSKKDTVKVYLRNINPPYNIIDSSKAIIDSISFQGLFEFLKAPTGTYYIIVMHRNTIETWSKAGGELFTNNSKMYYDFTNSQSQAFGNNEAQVDNSPVKFAIYSGDVDQNGSVDLTDIINVFNDANSFLTGYVSTDVTGDNFVDLSDLTLTFNNANAFVTKITPLSILDLKNQNALSNTNRSLSKKKIKN